MASMQARGSRGGLSAASLEAEMDKAASDAGKGGKPNWFGGASAGKKPLVPAMKDIGEETRFTEMFAATQAKRRMGQAVVNQAAQGPTSPNEPSAAAAVFGPNARSPTGNAAAAGQVDGGRDGVNSPGARQRMVGNGDADSSDDAESDNGEDYPLTPGFGDHSSAADLLRAMHNPSPSSNAAVPSGSKVSNWLDQVEHPRADGEGSASDDDQINPLKPAPSESTFKGNGVGGESGFKIPPQKPGLFTGPFEQVKHGGSVPEFKKDRKDKPEQAWQPLPPQPSASTRSEGVNQDSEGSMYTTAFKRGEVPQFPGEREEAKGDNQGFLDKLCGCFSSPKTH